MAEPIVQISHLTFSYGTRPALENLTLDIAQGEIFGFLGPNGSGKTTLFRILSTLMASPPGAVHILGFDPASERNQIRRRIGVVFQSPSLDKQLTAAENLTQQGRLYGLSGHELKSKVHAALSAMGLSERSGELVGQFSGGMRRRVEVAKGLLHDPQLLLLDEPSTGLDPAARIDLWRHLQTINQRDGVTVLVTTHLMEEADRCSRLAIMQQGRLLACDSPTNLKDRIGGDVISIESSDSPQVQAIFQQRLGIEAKEVGGILRLELRRGHEYIPKLIEAAPGLIKSISVGKPTLEDVFIHLTGQRLRSDAMIDEGVVARNA